MRLLTRTRTTRATSTTLSPLPTLVLLSSVGDLQDPVLRVVAVDGGDAPVRGEAEQARGQESGVAVPDPGDLSRLRVKKNSTNTV